MSRHSTLIVMAFALWFGCQLLGGCGQSIPPEVAAIRNRVVVSQEPAAAISIEDARKRVDENSDVVLTVRIGNRNFVNWSEKNHATFYVSEGFPGSDYNVGSDHDASTCPFCKWKWKEEDSLAIVQLVDSGGDVLPHAADSLLDLEQGSKVTIQGQGAIDEAGFLVVRLGSLFVHDR